MSQAPQAGTAELARAHCPAYVERFLRGELTEKEMRTIGFPWSEGLVRRSRASAGGTLAATRALLEWNLRITANIAGATAFHSLRCIAVGSAGDHLGYTVLNLAIYSMLKTSGGTHHAFRDRGEGFCVFNDIAVSAKAAMEEFGVERILVVDLDVHQACYSNSSVHDMHLLRPQPLFCPYC